jgi:O-antigen/teichoic acid export membrane protein
VILVGAFALNALASFALGLLVAKLLGPADFGRFALGMAVAVALNNLVFEWLRLSATRFYSARVREAAPWVRGALDAAYGRLALGLSALAVLVALVIAPGRIEIDAATGVLAASAGVAAVGLGLFDYGTALARARFEGRLYGRLVAVRTLGAVVLMSAAAWTGEPAAVLGAVALSTLAAVVVARPRLADPPATLRPREAQARRAAIGRFAAYAGPLVAANVLYQLMPVANRAALAAADGFAQSGQFALAADVAGRLFQTLGSAADLALFQLAVRAQEHEGRAAAEAQVARNAALVVAILLPFAGGLYVITPVLEALLVPAAFRGAFALYTELLIPGFLALSIASYALNPIFQLRGRTGPVILAAGIGIAVDLAALAVLVPRIGAPGVAVAQGLGLAAALAVLAVRALAGPDRLRLPWRDVLAAALATGAMVAAVGPLSRLDPPLLALGVSAVAGALVYGGLAWCFDIAGLRTLALQALRRKPSRAIASE